MPVWTLLEIIHKDYYLLTLLIGKYILNTEAAYPYVEVTRNRLWSDFIWLCTLAQRDIDYALPLMFPSSVYIVNSNKTRESAVSLIDTLSDIECILPHSKYPWPC